MSCSSSTTRMSSAINEFLWLSFRRLGGGRFGFAGKVQRRLGAAAVGRGKGNVAAVLLDDLLDDREAQAGAVLARGHVRFENVLAAFGQANPVVGDRDGEPLVVEAHRDRDPSAIVGLGVAA